MPVRTSLPLCRPSCSGPGVSYVIRRAPTEVPGSGGFALGDPGRTPSLHFLGMGPAWGARVRGLWALRAQLEAAGPGRSYGFYRAQTRDLPPGGDGTDPLFRFSSTGILLVRGGTVKLRGQHRAGGGAVRLGFD